MRDREIRLLRREWRKCIRRAGRDAGAGYTALAAVSLRRAEQIDALTERGLS